jgi:type IV pilus assembly protein PilC
MFQQEKRPRFKEILRSIKEDIETGKGLAESIARHPKVFSEFVIRVIEAGEVSGTLDQSLKRVAAQLEKLGRLKAKVRGAMVYPVATMVIAVIVTIFLLIKVIPEVAKLYSSSNAQLPVLTVFVLGISGWVQKNILMMLGVIIGAFVGFRVLYQRPEFREIYDPFVLKVPLFGPLIKKSSIARFTRTLGTLVSSGVPLLTAFDICIKLAENVVIKAILQNAVQSITEGKSIVFGLQYKNIFPPMVLHMVNIGEMTGRLDELLGKVSDIYDDEVDDSINIITGLLQPMMIVFVGMIIAFLLLAMYMPIFQLAEKVMGN